MALTEKFKGCLIKKKQDKREILTYSDSALKNKQD